MSVKHVTYPTSDSRGLTRLTRPRLASSTTHSQKDVEVSKLRLRYIDVAPECDEGRPPILLIHGHTSRLEEYSDLLPHLTRSHRVLVPDLPGSGYSDKPDRPYTLRFFEDSLLGFLDALSIERCYVGGGSLGGNLTLRLGDREPERFPKLAAWAPAGSWDPMPIMAGLSGLLKRLKFLFWPSLWIQSRFWYSKSWPGRAAAIRNAWAYYREVYGPAFHRMYWDIGIEQILTTLFERAPHINQPTYLAYGDRDDGLDMRRGVQRLAKLLPNVHLRCFIGARHALANELPEELGADVERFFSSAPVLVSDSSLRGIKVPGRGL